MESHLRKASILGTSSKVESFIPRGTLKVCDSRLDLEDEAGPITPMQIRKANFPGLPYAPSKFVLSEVRNAQRTVANEFIDFLDSVSDLLKLLLMVKTKHLRSQVPLPGDVIREIHYLDDKRSGQKMRQFEREIFGKQLLISHSSSSGKSDSSYSGSLLGSQKTSSGNHSPQRQPVHYDQSSFSFVKGKPRKHHTKSHTSNVDDQISSSFTKGKPRKSLTKSHTGNVGLSSLSKVFSKPSRPIWQVVDIGAEDKMELDKMLIVNHRRKLQQKMPYDTEYRKLLKKRFDVREDLGCRNLAGYLLTMNHRDISKEASFKRLMDMFQAYSAGFDNIKQWKLHLEATHPHWFKDLLQESLDLGVVVTKDVVLGFKRLGRFYRVDFSDVSHSRAKLCLIVQSLPFWDISRSTVQRALDFVLRHILQSPFTNRDIDSWLEARHIVRLVIPPMSMETGMKALSKESISVLPTYKAFTDKYNSTGGVQIVDRERHAKGLLRLSRSNSEVKFA